MSSHYIHRIFEGCCEFYFVLISQHRTVICILMSGSLKVISDVVQNNYVAGILYIHVHVHVHVRIHTCIYMYNVEAKPSFMGVHVCVMPSGAHK